jgi:hypothetical protein
MTTGLKAVIPTERSDEESVFGGRAVQSFDDQLRQVFKMLWVIQAMTGKELYAFGETGHPQLLEKTQKTQRMTNKTYH